MVLQQRLKTGHKENHRAEHHHRSHDGEQRGIDHGPGHLAAQLIQALEELRQAPQDLLKETRPFAGLDHRHMQRRKSQRMLPHGLGERLPVRHRALNLLQNLAEPGVDG